MNDLQKGQVGIYPVDMCCGQPPVPQQHQWHHACGVCGQHYWKGGPVLFRKATSLEADQIVADKAQADRDKLASMDGVDPVLIGQAPFAQFETFGFKVVRGVIVPSWLYNRPIMTTEADGRFTVGAGRPPWRADFEGAYRSWSSTNADMICFETSAQFSDRKWFGAYPSKELALIENNGPLLPREPFVRYYKTPGKKPIALP